MLLHTHQINHHHHHHPSSIIQTNQNRVNGKDRQGVTRPSAVVVSLILSSPTQTCTSHRRPLQTSSSLACFPCTVELTRPGR
jgi:hypothetical protein